jgi:hypothetical protein
MAEKFIQILIKMALGLYQTYQVHERMKEKLRKLKEGRWETKTKQNRNKTAMNGKRWGNSYCYTQSLNNKKVKKKAEPLALPFC